MFKFERHRRRALAKRASPGMTSNQDEHQADVYFRVMRLLQDNPQMTQRELARALGISLGGVNYCMKALINKGWVKIQNFRNSERKLAYTYLLTPKGITEKAALTAGFLKRKMHEFEGLKAEIQSLQQDLGKSSSVSQGSDDSANHPSA
jgi:EPS-associated MarR family transcriptional regulator